MGDTSVDHDPLAFLQRWYADHCDGDWEHEFGIEIGTIDNPGWRVMVDLSGTELEDSKLDREVIARSSDDWLQFWSDGLRFEAVAGPRNLGQALDAFRTFCQSRRG